MRRRQTCSPHFSVMSFWLTLEAPACSRICNGQSTKQPQGSTGTDQHEVGYSIKITYFHPISTDFHKRPDLLWDRWSRRHNLHELSGLQRGLAGDSAGFVALQVSSLRLCAGILQQITSDSLSGKHRIAPLGIP